jgi:acetoacetyl-CoA synthetase
MSTSRLPIDSVLWQPAAEQIKACELTRFAGFANERWGAPAPTADPATSYAALHAWTLRDPGAFWTALWDFSGVIGTRGRHTLRDADQMPGARWFEDSTLNYAENLLAGPPGEVALIARNEAGARAQYTRAELRNATLAAAAALAQAGIGRGDVVAGFVANTVEAVIGMLATAWLGAVWTSTSTDFGAASVVERIGQTGARVLFATSCYQYGGKTHRCLDTIRAIGAALPGLQQIVLIGAADADSLPPRTLHWHDFMREPAQAPTAARMPFNAPLFILFSSGTTGKPKAIVHGIGGTLLQHRKEHLLHTDIRAGDRVFFYTTCGWMMWNWLVSALASRATVVLYDGAPTFPDTDVLWQLAEQEQLAVFGTSPRYLAAVEKSGLRPKDRHSLATLRALLSTGSPLSASQFDFVYRDIKSDLQLASISGGTDIVSCFCLGVPWLPVRRGEIQAAGLGMATDVVDEQGRPVVDERGELVCTAPFPSMPLGFLHDADGQRFHAAYFGRFAGMWCHGDYAVRTPHGGFVILGRSDAVLNPGGVRIGTAEIYRQVERVAAVLESLAIGQKLGDGDERIVLFVRLAPGAELDAALEQEIRQAIRSNTTPRHVPARIVAVADLPRTLSGKLMELAVRNVVHGLPVQNRDALANPESLALFQDLPQLRN